jgi:uncharacterized protein YidB (DUF937 family)
MTLLDSMKEQMANILNSATSGGAGDSAALGGGIPAEKHEDLLSGLHDLIQSQGLGNILDAFKNKALGGSSSAAGAESALATEAPRDLLQGIFQNEHIAALAQRIGVTPEAVSSALSSILPGLLGRLSATGQQQASAVGAEAGAAVSS